MKLSPIVLFVCKRPKHTRRVLSSLKKNKLYKLSNLIIYVDKPDKEEDLKSYNKVLEIIKNIKGFKKKTLILRSKNYGLAKNFIDGITRIFKKYKKAIILEDDNLISPYFLDFMNNALEIYKNNKKISSIYAYFPNTKTSFNENFFLKGSWTFTWGIGIWRRSWRYFQADEGKLLQQIDNKKLQRKFNFDNTYDWYSMLQRFKNKQNKSWSIRWYASTFLKNYYTLFPKYPLCKNIGMDGTGENTPKSNIWDVKLYRKKINIKRIKVQESKIAYDSAKYFFKSIEPIHLKFFNFIKKKIYIFLKTLIDFKPQK